MLRTKITFAIMTGLLAALAIASVASATTMWTDRI